MQGKLTITGEKGSTLTATVGENYYEWLKFPLVKNSDYEILVSNLEVSIAYLSGNDNILEEGICFLTFDPDVKKIQGKQLSDFYDTPYREQYHFVPFKNWINDPNGLCWYKGKYHLFYQANPHSQKWDNMYWGHAASPDLIHWVHLPYVFEPQKEILKNPALKGGAFSGSAVPFKDEVYFYLTRHLGPLEDGDSTLEWQTMTKSRDMLNFDEEKVIIRSKPAGVGHDFRDPKVFRANGKWYLVLGANLNGDSAILLYSSSDLCNWTYENPLILEKDRRSTTFECPDCFELDGKYVAVGAMMNHVDEHNRRQMTKYYVGNFENQTFHVAASGLFDFGGNFYAVQSFEHEGRRIAIGWISDFYGEHIRVPNGAYGSFSIPRVLSLHNFRLHMEPVPEIYSLKEKAIYSGRGENVSLQGIKGNSYYANLEFCGSTDFNILLGENGGSSISLQRLNGVTKIKTDGVKSENVDFVSDAEDIENIEIFVDRRVVEVYLNHGYSVGTKLFYNATKNGVFKAVFDHQDAVAKIEVNPMKSIW